MVEKQPAFALDLLRRLAAPAPHEREPLVSLHFEQEAVEQRVGSTRFRTAARYVGVVT